MITTTAWVPRGFAAPFPKKYDFDEEEFERIATLAKLQLDDAKEDFEDAQDKENDEDDDEEERPEDSENQSTSKSKKSTKGSSEAKEPKVECVPRFCFPNLTRPCYNGRAQADIVSQDRHKR